jgi:hypothetical protein
MLCGFAEKRNIAQYFSFQSSASKDFVELQQKTWIISNLRIHKT